MKKQLIFPAIVLVMGGAAVLGATQTYAQTQSSGHSSLIQKIAQKFGLKETDVQAVFDEDRSEHQAEKQTMFDAKLTQAVTDGKITEAQKQLILTKRIELEKSRQTEFESFKDKTPEERKALMEKHRQEIQDWAKQNNIDIKYLMGFGMRGHGPMGKMRR
jgi:hypothetical protein